MTPPNPLCPAPPNRRTAPTTPWKSSTSAETSLLGPAEPPGMTDACTYCGCDVTAHDPVFVYEGAGDDRTAAGRFCNYGCLRAHVDDEGLAEGARCRLDV